MLQTTLTLPLSQIQPTKWVLCPPFWKLGGKNYYPNRGVHWWNLCLWRVEPSCFRIYPQSRISGVSKCRLWLTHTYVELGTIQGKMLGLGQDLVLSCLKTITNSSTTPHRQRRRTQPTLQVDPPTSSRPHTWHRNGWQSCVQLVYSLIWQRPSHLLDNFFNSPVLFSRLAEKQTGACGTLRKDRQCSSFCQKR